MSTRWTQDFEARARRHVVTALRMAGIALAGGRPTDILVHDARFFTLVYHRGMAGLDQAERLGWWACADPARVRARLGLARRNGAPAWSLRGPAISPPVVTAA